MKRHYIAALFLLVFAGLSLYEGFHDGEMGRPIWMGIAWIVLGVVAFFYDKLRPWLRPVFVALPIILLGGMIVIDLLSGYIVGAIVAGVTLIFAGVFVFFRDRPFVENKMRPWLRPIPITALCVLLIWKLFSVVERKMEESPKPVGFHQKPDVSPGSAPSGDLQVIPEPVLSDLNRKVMDILTSEGVKEEIKAAAAAGTMPEFLESFSNFKDYMISKGMTEFAMLDQAPSRFQYLFQKHYPGKAPSDLDSEMRQRLIELIQEFGYEKGRTKFLRTPKIAVWTAARFNILDNPEDISAWTSSVYTSEFENIEPASVSGSPPPTVLPEETSFDKIISDIPSAEIEQVPANRAPKEPWEEPTIPDTKAREVTASLIEQERVVTEVSPEPPALSTEAELETTLKEHFSSERFERAMSTLERYGPEEGLRRLREDDPEVAEQIEDSRNGVESSRRAGVEQQRDREDKEEDDR